jgi:hypothetical protein
VTTTILSLGEAVELSRTGDLWLFLGRSAADRAIRALTNSPVNHVGMAIALDDLPPRCCGTRSSAGPSPTYGREPTTGGCSSTT